MAEGGLHQGPEAPPGTVLQEAVSRAMEGAVAAVIVGGDDRVRHVSSRWCELTGWGPDEVRDFSWYDLMVGDAPTGPAPGARDLQLRCADGSLRWVRCESTPLHDADDVAGAVSGARLLVCVDIAGRKRAEAVLGSAGSTLAALIDNVHLGVLLVDGAGIVTSVNASFLREVEAGGGPESYVGQPIAMVRHRFRRAWADPARNRAMLGRIRRRGEPVTDAHFEMAGGSTLAVSYVPIPTGNGAALAGGASAAGQMWLVRDVTDARAVAVEREYLLAIEKEQNARLKELDAMKSQLVAQVSHELRTPLTSIVSFTRLLRDGLGRDPEEDQIEFLDILERNTDRLIRLVDDLLLLDKLDSNLMPFDFEPVDVGQLVTQAVASLRPAAEAKDIELEVECRRGPPLQGDAQRLGQLADNLLANAVKFTPVGGRVVVRATPDGSGWRLEVADTGIGVPVGEQEELFERFFRASNARRQAMAGSGLGLAIVKRIVQAHGGTVEVVSSEGEGTVFAVTLPGVGRPVPASSGAEAPVGLR